MNSSRRKKTKQKQCLVRAVPKDWRTQPVCFCGDKSHHWWHSVVSGKQLGSISQRSVRPAWTTAHFYTHQIWKAHVHVWMVLYIVWGLTLIRRIWRCWIRGHLLFAAESCWTTVSYVNWPFVQCAKWNQHIQGCTYLAPTDKMQLFTLPGNSLCNRDESKALAQIKTGQWSINTPPTPPPLRPPWSSLAVLWVTVHVPQTRWSVLSNPLVLNHHSSLHSSTNPQPCRI